MLLSGLLRLVYYPRRRPFLLEKGCSPSTLKAYVAAIAASHVPIWSISGQEQPGCSFLKGSRRLNPPCPVTVPTWNLPTVLRALNSPPFELIQSVDLRPLTLKTALLLALASVKHMGDLQALQLAPLASNSGLTIYAQYHTETLGIIKNNYITQRIVK